MDKKLLNEKELEKVSGGAGESQQAETTISTFGVDAGGAIYNNGIDGSKRDLDRYQPDLSPANGRRPEFER